MSRTVLLIFILLLIASIGLGQNKINSPMVELSSQDLLITVANQPKSPVRIENVRAFLSSDSTEVVWHFSIRNLSKKIVWRLALSNYNVAGGGGDLVPIELDSKRLLRPGQSFLIGPKKHELIVPLDEKLRNQLKLSNEMISVTIFLIKEVNFTDGSKFEDQTTLDHFAKFNTRVYLQN